MSRHDAAGPPLNARRARGSPWPAIDGHCSCPSASRRLPVASTRLPVRGHAPAHWRQTAAIAGFLCTPAKCTVRLDQSCGYSSNGDVLDGFLMGTGQVSVVCFLWMSFGWHRTGVYVLCECIFDESILWLYFKFSANFISLALNCQSM